MQRTSQRNEQLERLRRRYAGRGKEGKSRLLDEFCEQHGYDRKYAIKLLQPQPELPSTRPRPGPQPRMSQCRRLSNGSGIAPSTCVASGWLRLWSCGCRITPDTTGSCYPRKRNYWSRSVRRPWTGCWPNAKPERTGATTALGLGACCAIRCRFKGKYGMSGGWGFWKPIVSLTEAAVWRAISFGA